MPRFDPDSAIDREVEARMAEMEIAGLREKPDLLRKTQWKELVDVQQRQIVLLEHQIALSEQQMRLLSGLENGAPQFHSRTAL